MKHTIILAALFLFISCAQTEEQIAATNRQHKINRCDTALNLTIEKNSKIRVFSYKPGYFSSNIVTKVLMIPINSEVIRALVDAKIAKENLNTKARETYIQEAHRRFWNKKRTTFAIFVINSALDNDCSVMFPAFQNSTTLNLDNGESHYIDTYTSSLDMPLNPGVNYGYVYFDCSIPENVNSYSVNFGSLNLKNGKDIYQTSYALAFDNTNLNFLALLEKGIKPEEVRTQYASAFSSFDISAEEAWQIISTLMKIASKAIEIFK